MEYWAKQYLKNIKATLQVFIMIQRRDLIRSLHSRLMISVAHSSEVSKSFPATIRHQNTEEETRKMNIQTFNILIYNVKENIVTDNTV